MPGFISRHVELQLLKHHFDTVATKRPAGVADSRESRGHQIFVTGPDCIGKTRLVAEFLRTLPVPTVTVTISRLPEDLAVQHAVASVLASDLPGRTAFDDVLVETWAEFFRVLVRSLPAEEPSVLAIDDVHVLPDTAATIMDGALEQLLENRPVLAILIGPDTDISAPEHCIRLDGLSPADIARAGALDSIPAIDAYLITGGLPGLVRSWPHRAGITSAIDSWLSTPAAPALLDVERILGRHTAADSAERSLLAVIARGIHSRAAIGRAAHIPPASADRALRRLVESGLVRSELPLSAVLSRETRYYLANSAIAWYLRYVADYRHELAAAASTHTIARATADWESWRGSVMVHFARETLGRVAAQQQLPGARIVGGYWTRSGDVTVDLVGTDGAAIDPKVAFIGAVKWSARDPFAHIDLARVMSYRDVVPGAHEGTPIVIVAMAGSAVGDAATATLGADDLLQAWAAR